MIYRLLRRGIKSAYRQLGCITFALMLIVPHWLNCKIWSVEWPYSKYPPSSNCSPFSLYPSPSIRPLLFRLLFSPSLLPYFHPFTIASRRSRSLSFQILQLCYSFLSSLPLYKSSYGLSFKVSHWHAGGTLVTNQFWCIFIFNRDWKQQFWYLFERS